MLVSHHLWLRKKVDHSFYVFYFSYALGRYQFRAWQLRTGRYIMSYDDLYGPSVLCICLVIALIVNFYLRVPAMKGDSN